MNAYKDLILQVLILLFPVFFYQMFFAATYNDSQTKKKSRIIFFLALITMIVSMSFPIFSNDGMRYDLRYVILMFGVLYGGGYTSGILLFIILLAYRYSFGGSGFYYTIFEGMFIIPFIFLLYRRFLRSNRARRSAIVAIISLYISLVFLADHLLFIDKKITYFYLGIASILIFSSWITIFIIENIRDNHRLQQEVQQMEKLKVLGELTSSFAHEIRNPLQVSRGFMQLLGESAIPLEKQKGYLNLCLEELDRANTIITDYLSFAKPEVKPTEPIEINQELRKLADILESYALLQNTKIQLDLETNEVWIMANQQKLRQSLINIIKNGIEAMHDGGILLIRCIPKNSEVLIQITDQGIGMTEAELKRLGTPFYSLKEKGTGLGLMISYRIIESFNGKISVYSEKGKSTTFTIGFRRISPTA